MTTTDLDLAARARRLRERALAVLDDPIAADLDLELADWQADALDRLLDPLEALRQAMRSLPPRPVAYVHPTRFAEIEHVAAACGVSAVSSRFVPVDLVVVDRCRPIDRITGDG